MDKQLPVSVWPEWKIVEKIGEGSFGKVYKAKRTEQGKTFYSAIKVITIPSNAGELSSIRSENPDEQSVKEYFHSQTVFPESGRRMYPGSEYDGVFSRQFSCSLC